MANVRESTSSSWDEGISASFVAKGLGGGRRVAEASQMENGASC